MVREARIGFCAGDHGSLDEADGKITPIADPESHLPDNRFNDGKCDPAGRFWAGTIHLASPRQPIAALYCLEKDLTLSKKLDQVMNSNGIVWTRDGKAMYYIDTPRKTVRALDFDVATGALANERVVLDTSKYDGGPDGMAIDAEDRLWIAFCHASVVRCFESQNFRSSEAAIRN